MGLDETELFKQNHQVLAKTMRGSIDISDGISTLQYEVLRNEPLPYACPGGMLGHAQIQTVRFSAGS